MTQAIHRLTAPFQTLRGKLILSYTTVTVGALVATAFILAALVFSQIFPPDSVLTPEDLSQFAAEEIVPPLRPILANPAVRQFVTPELLADLEAVVSSRELVQIGNTSLVANATADFEILIVDRDGILVGKSGNRVAPDVSVGQPLAKARFAELDGLLAAALAGEDSLEKLTVTLNPSKEYLFVVPVTDDVNGRTELLGAIVNYVGPLPTQSDVANQSLAVAGRGFLLFVIVAGLLGTIFGSITAGGIVRRFQRLTQATGAWSQGNFANYIKDSSRDEIGQLAGQLDDMARQLQALLVQRQEMAVSEERNRLARDLHDSAKQQAFAASAQLAAAAALIEQDPAAAKAHLLEGQNLVDKVRRELTDLILKLRPAIFDQGGLPVALREHTVEWAQQNDIEVALIFRGERQLPLEVEQALYRITQEALANTARHSGARHVDLALVYEPKSVILTVADNGRGFDLNEPTSGIGLNSISERAELIGAEVTIDSDPETGTRITVISPID